MLPLIRPDLFNGGLLKLCRGILLFGPPGTGKTMLAKTIANKAGASFKNVSVPTITSKWFGKDAKNVRALFTLAAKVFPMIVFVDEVDSMLGQRTRVGEYEAMRKIKNKFMTHWDGLLTKLGEHIFVLAATNRPFDLDEAIIRQFERRYITLCNHVEELSFEDQVQMNFVTPQIDDQPEEQAEDVSTQNKRGRKQMHNVHARKERKLILLNRENQLVGPTDDVVIKLSSFLGTLARNVTL